MKDIVLQKPTAEQYINICNELGEHLERFQTNLQLLKDWIRSQPHLPQNYDNEILPVFLRGCKHDLERTKRKLDNYFSARLTFTDLLSNKDPLCSEILMASNHFHIATIPKLAPTGHRVTFHKFTNPDATQFIPKDVFRLILLIADLRILEETPIAGDIFIFDVKHMSTGHCTRLAHPALLSRILTVVQQAYPQRLAQIHLINAPPYINKLLTLFKTFMREKMRNRFIVHTDASKLSTIVPKDCTPEDYGGNLPTLETLHDAWQRKLAQNRDWFLKQQNIVCDNSKRIEKNNNIFNTENIFGTDGAFRKLNID